MGPVWTPRRNVKPAVGWIFGVYNGLTFLLGVQTGPIFDARGPRALICKRQTIVDAKDPSHGFRTVAAELIPQEVCLECSYAQTGPIFDARGPRALICCGGILTILYLMLLGICTEYSGQRWQ
jgi:hypothetical protein